jgi:hypothetical protein
MILALNRAAKSPRALFGCTTLILDQAAKTSRKHVSNSARIGSKSRIKDYLSLVEGPDPDFCRVEDCRRDIGQAGTVVAVVLKGTVGSGDLEESALKAVVLEGELEFVEKHFDLLVCESWTVHIDCV